MKLTTPCRMLALMALALSCVSTQASVTLSGTRVVFPGADKEVTVQLSNDGKAPALIQAWIDNGDERAAPDQIDVPFVITPTIFRLEAGKGQTLRIIHSGEALPADKESLFWLNVLDVPPKASTDDDRNRLMIAFRSRVKLMYRPEGLPGNAADAPRQLTWKIATDSDNRLILKATNPTPYVVNLGGIALHANGKTLDAGVGYVRPGETASFPVRNSTNADATGGTVVYSSFDDWGGNRANEAAVSR
ncbi:pilus assembly protein [Burkholderia cepacia]|uniref:Pilus assembly protein n=1 Tax=Burkholderia cepacia TaxID=292 RepID=A0A118IS80_BURCE|nr:fimbria/pilus periplasmic chaperone [Burkholderia cepacia]KVH33042.1 pilus assembly protein [Burkholderia cepacia]KVK85642.1 pilus assembly protein [Burkholderia cepacia]KVK96695.1 pilus assembly protein [Burkholderia cepacia]KVL47677.1 pilus assembly protein [Burkholderia cepacia]